MKRRQQRVDIVPWRWPARAACPDAGRHGHAGRAVLVVQETTYRKLRAVARVKVEPPRLARGRDDVHREHRRGGRGRVEAAVALDVKDGELVPDVLDCLRFQLGVRAAKHADDELAGDDGGFNPVGELGPGEAVALVGVRELKEVEHGVDPRGQLYGRGAGDPAGRRAEEEEDDEEEDDEDDAAEEWRWGLSAAAAGAAFCTRPEMAAHSAVACMSRARGGWGGTGGRGRGVSDATSKYYRYSSTISASTVRGKAVKLESPRVVRGARRGRVNSHLVSIQKYPSQAIT